MTVTLNLTPTLEPALLSMWVEKVACLLGAPTKRVDALVGVDIGHVDMPDLVASEPCAGFVSRGGRIEATCMNFQQSEAMVFAEICRIVTGSSVASRMTHWALCDKTPQINTLIFRAFTLAYSYDRQPPQADRGAFLKPRLILHEADLMDGHELCDSMQASLDAFTTAHDDFGNLRLRAPTPEGIKGAFQRSAA